MIITTAYSFLSQNASLITLALALLTLLTLTTSTLRVFFASSAPHPKNATWSPSHARGPLAALHSALHSTLNIKQTLLLGSQNASVQKPAFLISTVLDGAPLVLPLSDVSWLAALPNTVASMHALQYERLKLGDTLPSTVAMDPRVVRRVVKLLGQRSREMVAVVHREVREVCPKSLYGRGEWRCVGVHEEVMRILAATTNRFLVGEPLC